MLSTFVFRSGINLCTGRQSISKLLVSKPNAHSSIKSRKVSNQTGKSVSKTTKQTRSKSLMEFIMSPAGGVALLVGKGVALGASVLGLGALAYYGLGSSSEPDAIINKSKMWPEDVKKRIRATYTYFCGSIVITAVSVAACSYSIITWRIVERHPLICFFGPMAVMLASFFPLLYLPYQEGFRVKQGLWALHCAAMGAYLTPLCFILGGPLTLRAVMYTAGVVGGLSTVAVCAPSDKFLSMGGPLGECLGVLFAVSLANLVLPPVTAIGSGLFSISLYGGLVLFSALLLCDTQEIIHHAETHSDYPDLGISYDPINACLGIYLGSINIFIRIAFIVLEASAKEEG